MLNYEKVVLYSNIATFEVLSYNYTSIVLNITVQQKSKEVPRFLAKQILNNKEAKQHTYLRNLQLAKPQPSSSS